MNRKLLLVTACAVVGLTVLSGSAVAGPTDDPDGDGYQNWYDECDWVTEEFNNYYDGDGCPEGPNGGGGGDGGDCPQECLASVRTVGGQ